MSFKAVLILVAAAATSVFLLINWQVLSAPANFRFLVGSADIPIGVAIIGLLGLVGLACAIYVGIWQGTVLAEYRRQSKELQAQRVLADSAETSRFTELTTLLREEMLKLHQRLELPLEALRVEVRDNERSIAATLAEMDDRLQRAMSGSPVEGSTCITHEHARS
jgi:uncharacterized integral membrane protein